MKTENSFLLFCVKICSHLLQNSKDSKYHSNTYIQTVYIDAHGHAQIDAEINNLRPLNIIKHCVNTMIMWLRMPS